LDFGQALKALKSGMRVSRSGWNGKSMWLLLVPGTEVPHTSKGSAYYKAGLNGRVTIDAHIDMFTASGSMQPGWLASQQDMLAEDYYVIE